LKRLLNSYLTFMLLLTALFCCAFIVVCNAIRAFGFYATVLFQRDLDFDSWAAVAFASGIVLFVLLAASIWIMAENGRLVLWKSTKLEFGIVTFLIFIMIIMIFFIVRFGTLINRLLRILAFPLAAYILFMFWLIRLTAFLQTGNRYMKISWYKFYKQFPIRQPISALMTFLLLTSFIYLFYDINTGEIILTIFHFALVTALAELLSRFSETKAAEFEKIAEDRLKAERLKTELIANVSHDIKTPITSIINYADLIGRQSTDNERLKEYTSVIRKKSLRLKSLMEDLIEASKAGTGNIKMTMETIDFCELLGQIMGEYDEQMGKNQLQLISKIPETPVRIRTDGRYLWRVMENIFSNAVKYSMPGTRVYADLAADEGLYIFTLKNISKDPLNISADELTEQFVRGDRARFTEGNGLGLYIAKSLTEAMGGRFGIKISGDLFEVQICFTRLQ
jgi:signal transduction histidine kinase